MKKTIENEINDCIILMNMKGIPAVCEIKGNTAILKLDKKQEAPSMIDNGSKVLNFLRSVILYNELRGDK